MEMDGKNRAASSCLNPGDPPADKERNDLLAQVFRDAYSYDFSTMTELLHRLIEDKRGAPELPLRDDPTQKTLHLGADANLVFPRNDTSALKRSTSGASRMTATFMRSQGN